MVKREKENGGVYMSELDWNFDEHFTSTSSFICKYCGEQVDQDYHSMKEHYNDCDERKSLDNEDNESEIFLLNMIDPHEPSYLTKSRVGFFVLDREPTQQEYCDMTDVFFQTKEKLVNWNYGELSDALEEYLKRQGFKIYEIKQETVQI
jgi:hypothetical protein